MNSELRIKGLGALTFVPQEEEILRWRVNNVWEGHRVLTTDIYKKLHLKALLLLLSCPQLPGCKVRSTEGMRKCYTNFSAHTSTSSQILEAHRRHPELWFWTGHKPSGEDMSALNSYSPDTLPSFPEIGVNFAGYWQTKHSLYKTLPANILKKT